MLGLDDAFGPDNAATLSAAYQAILQTLLEGGPGLAISRDTRLAIVTRLLAEARRGVFDPERLRTVGLGAS